MKEFDQKVLEGGGVGEDVTCWKCRSNDKAPRRHYQDGAIWVCLKCDAEWLRWTGYHGTFMSTGT